MRRSSTACLNNQPVLANCCPVFDQKTLAMKFDQVLNTSNKASFYVNREWRTRNNSVGRPLRCAAGQAHEPVPASEDAELARSGRRRTGWSTTACCTASRSATTPSTNSNRSVYFNQGWPSLHRADEPAGHDVPALRVDERRPPILRQHGELRIRLARPQLRGQHDRPGRRDVICGPAQHQERLRGPLLLRGQRERRRDAPTTTSLSAQTNLPGFDQTTGHAYASFLLGAVATSNRAVQAVNTDYYQRDFAFYVQDDFKVSSKLTLNLGLRWQILPGDVREERVRHQRRPHAAQRGGGQPAGRPAVRRPGGPEDLHRHVLQAVPAAPRHGVRDVVGHGDQRRLQLEQPARARPTAAATTSAASTRPATTARSRSRAPRGRRRTPRIRSCT